MDLKNILKALNSGEINLADAKEKILLSRQKHLNDDSPVGITSQNTKNALPDAPSSSSDNDELISESPKIDKQISTNNCKTYGFQEFDRRDPIAIVGMSGRYPGASDLNVYWDNLLKAKDSIREIPPQRFDISQYYKLNPNQNGKIYCKWIGMVDNVECFDPLFFAISPSEAELIDPQHRLFLEEGYKAFEDAGYTTSQLSNCKCGVYLGIMEGDYSRLLPMDDELNSITGSSSAIAAARIAYHLNLKGPAIAINTACSSSLVATHLACQALRSNEICMAVVGGVSLYLSPQSYVQMCTAGMLSTKGRCSTFDESADGFVPADGVGAMVLKRLSDAEIEHDHIYGIIIASGINQDGKTNGITAPSAQSQVALIRDTYEKFGIDPESIGYIETHGTGTKLGDPIELVALAKAYLKPMGQLQYCAVGSVKSNIGHSTAAAGVAGVQKALLCLSHKTLVPSLHFNTPNEHFNFNESPFYVNTESKHWNIGRKKTRRAAVSSFGLSGTNAHIVLEEYTMPEREKIPVVISTKLSFVIVLSAKNEERLKEQVLQLLQTTDNGIVTDAILADISYTLQVGREAMDVRLGMIVNSIKDLKLKLIEFVNGQSAADVYHGQVKRTKEMIAAFTEDEDHQKLISLWIEKKMYGKIVDIWAKGLNFDWQLLYNNDKPYRISLPTYPFAKERYWVPLHKTTVLENPGAMSASTVPIVEEQLESYEMMTFEEVWHEQSEQVTSLAEIKTLVCFISNLHHQDAIEKMIRNHNSQAEVIFVAQSDGVLEKWSSREYGVSPTDVNVFNQVFKSIKDDHGEVDAILYMWALEDPERVRDYSCIVNILQAVASSKLKVNYLLLSSAFNNALDRCFAESWIGFDRSLRLVLPNVVVTTICLDVATQNCDEAIQKLIQNLWSELHSQHSQSVLYQKGKRFIHRIQPTEMQSGDSLLKRNGTYLITGGCGGLGLLFAEYIAKQYSGNLILVGRSSLSEDKQQKINALKTQGSQVYYLQADVSDEAGFKEGLNKVKERFHSINGVIHAAGIEGKRSILEKDMQSFAEVLRPKIDGTIVLDNLLKDEKLDFMCYFSSSSAILGDFGSCDYSVGNRFLMAYAENRNQLFHNGQRSWKTISINWPLWKEGGMGVGSSENTAMYLKSSGQRSLGFEEGAELFERILAQQNTQHLVLVGQPNRVKRFLGMDQKHASVSKTPEIKKGKGRRVEMRGMSLEQCVQWDLKELSGVLLKISREKLDLQTNLADFGFDSISLAQFATVLSKHYALDVTPGTFFGYSTLEKLSEFFIEKHNEAIKNFYTEDSLNQVVNSPRVATFEPVKKQRLLPGSSIKRADAKDLIEPIAIIGMSGRFPQANTVEMFWKNLQSGKNCITEIPAQRWNWQENSSIACRWGGFIDEIDRFDPLFFNIPPIEAEFMDPRQRMFLEEAWHSLEDAGYMGERIKGMSCGVFVGVEEGEYNLLVGDRGQINSNQNATLSARIAYALDLKGPNMALTAACSSGLVALHQACLSLRQGDCEMALAGGISILFSSQIYSLMNQAGLLSSSGYCRVFDKKSDGLIPAEAIAVVVLKPLSSAIADGDQIYGCVKGSCVNYDGKTNGITAPSPLSQAELIQHVYKKYQINPTDIQFVLAHSVGSKQGDPIEFEALTDAFKTFTDRKQFCVIGSIKPLIGHTFAASGIVGLISMLMSMKHKTIPGLYNFESLNEYIHLDNSPFLLNPKNQPWLSKNGQPRTGAISTTGINGTNAHVVIEEHLSSRVKSTGEKRGVSPKIAVFSAKNQERLNAVALQMLDFIKSGSCEGSWLSDACYTLQIAREAMKVRLAIVVCSVAELREKLELFTTLPNEVSREKGIFIGNTVKSGQECSDTLLDLDGKEDKVGILMTAEYLEHVASTWVEGGKIQWDRFYSEETVRRISLPTYPFVKRVCWVSHNDSDGLGKVAEKSSFRKLYEENASELYSMGVKGKSMEFQEEYLTFCPFEQRVEGFSMSRVFLDPDKYPIELELMRSKQIEMRQVLFCKENLSRIHSVFDIGCGFGTDLIRIAERHTQIKAQGYTITQAQADLGNDRITQKKLAQRCEIFCRNSARDAFPDSYDLIIGFEVCCHIPDKRNLFSNIASSLNDGGRVLIIDFISNLHGAIEDPNVAIAIPTSREWVETLSECGFEIDDLIDVSAPVANFLYDPAFEQNAKGKPKVVRDSIQNYANSSMSLQRGWISYCLFKLEKNMTLESSELAIRNMEKISNKKQYSEALAEMVRLGEIYYPKSTPDYYKLSAVSEIGQNINGCTNE